MPGIARSVRTPQNQPSPECPRGRTPHDIPRREIQNYLSSLFLYHCSSLAEKAFSTADEHGSTRMKTMMRFHSASPDGRDGLWMRLCEPGVRSVPKRMGSRIKGMRRKGLHGIPGNPLKQRVFAASRHWRISLDHGCTQIKRMHTDQRRPSASFRPAVAGAARGRLWKRPWPPPKPARRSHASAQRSGRNAWMRGELLSGISSVCIRVNPWFQLVSGIPTSNGGFYTNPRRTNRQSKGLSAFIPFIPASKAFLLFGERRSRDLQCVSPTSVMKP